MQHKHNTKITQIPTDKRQQICGTARVLENNIVKFIQTGCSIERKADFNPKLQGIGSDCDGRFERL